MGNIEDDVIFATCKSHYGPFFPYLYLKFKKVIPTLSQVLQKAMNQSE